MKRKLTTVSRRLGQLKKKNQESQLFLEKLAVQGEGEFDTFFIRAKTEVQIKENQIRKDLNYRYDAEEAKLRGSLKNIDQVCSTLGDLRVHAQKVRTALADSCLIRSPE